jgi:hypothetical protein
MWVRIKLKDGLFRKQNYSVKHYQIALSSSDLVLYIPIVRLSSFDNANSAKMHAYNALEV